MGTRILNLRGRMTRFYVSEEFYESYIFEQEDLRQMTNVEITWYLGRAIADIRNVEEKLRNEEDANMLGDIRVKLDKLRVKYDLLNC